MKQFKLCDFTQLCDFTHDHGFTGLVVNIMYLAQICNSYTMGCPPVRGDNSRALASGLSYVLVDKHVITILYHLH